MRALSPFAALCSVGFFARLSFALIPRFSYGTAFLALAALLLLAVPLFLACVSEPAG